ncbi:hypothetical protein EPUS_02211 [Endocarpon pusillum Z07020]|uniref:Glucose-methanol-choline oxidoreductase N-terminal domain-containing protein n=1 Tax=Endocarpon pusillum (strain Z07020 / HMAS-L-300199) TaxID=1263415 RepID=U1GG89_ENDPU|nr:uncharacterized protein EPUS_02211 [Endocarpon pusillum Z07020]ERF76672.1 hypothetical protein EPUS_02211 [Endocarpon pusillum Z07020]
MLLSHLTSLLSLLAAASAAVNHEHSYNRFHRRQDRTTAGTNASEEYDYVVVGSGAGGGPVAARLALAGHSVLVLEAGEDMADSIYTNVPALSILASEYPPMAWNFFVNHYPDLETQRRDSKMTWRTPDGEIWVQLLNGTTPPEGSEPLGILYPRSGTVGGSSQHNAQVMVYPHASDFQYIVDRTGDSSWDPSNMRQYFERLEKVEYLPNSVAGHGFAGWLATSLTDLTLIAEDLKVVSLILSAATAMGNNIITSLLTTVTGLASTLLLDLNNPSSARDKLEAMYQVPLSINAADKTRSGPRNFLYEVANTVNADGTRKYKLDIQTNSLVTNIVFDTTGDKPKAVGVDYLSGRSLYRADPRAAPSGNAGTPGTVSVNREVIISGGTFNTPQILKLSGVGPASELSQFSIPVVVDLPGVGTNMQDHFEITVVGQTDSDFALIDDCTFQLSQPDPCLDRYNNPVTPATGEPDLFVTGVPINFVGYFPGYSTYAVQERNYWSWLILKAHPANRAGTVKLRSTDPRDTPVIDFNYFQTGTTSDGADEKDLQALYDGVNFSRRAFDKLIPLDGSFDEVQPGRGVEDEDAVKQYIKDGAWGHHASCSCPIGGDDDPMAVLDSKFRVRGVDGLRVVDASVFPTIPGYFVALPIHMIAEKAAEDILAAAEAADRDTT